MVREGDGTNDQLCNQLLKFIAVQIFHLNNLNTYVGRQKVDASIDQIGLCIINLIDISSIDQGR